MDYDTGRTWQKFSYSKKFLKFFSLPFPPNQIKPKKFDLQEGGERQWYVCSAPIKRKQPKTTLVFGLALAVRSERPPWASSFCDLWLVLLWCAFLCLFLKKRMKDINIYITPTARHIRYRQKRITLCACSENATPNFKIIIHLFRFKVSKAVFFAFCMCHTNHLLIFQYLTIYIK